MQNKEKKKADIEEIISLLNKAPYGLNKELIYFLLAVLTYLGKIELLQKKEIKITISTLKTYFVDKMSLFNKGLNKMDKIKYIILREDNYKNLKCVFKILDLNLDLLEPETSNHRLFLQYKNKINSLKKKVNRSKNQLTRISKNIANQVQRLKNIIKEKDKGLSDLLPRKLLNVEYISDL